MKFPGMTMQYYKILDCDSKHKYLLREITSSIGLGIKAPEGFPGFTTVTICNYIIVMYASKMKYYQLRPMHTFLY